MRSLALPSVLALTLAACGGGNQPLPTLTTVSQGSTSRTRAELEQLLADYESQLSSRSVTGPELTRIRGDAEEVRRRLEFGDFRVGDRLTLTVQGEADVPDTVSVQPGNLIRLPLFGDIPVGGILRSEVSDHLTAELSNFIRDPVVQAVPLMRVSVLGAVGNPGFFTMPAETVLGDALMVAGGPNGNADLESIEITRGNATVLADEGVQEALRLGLTLDQLNLLAGDQIVVPQASGGWFRIALTVVGTVASVTWLVIRITRL